MARLSLGLFRQRGRNEYICLEQEKLKKQDKQAMRAKYLCDKCGRIAAEKDLTGKPCKIKKLSGD